MENAGVLFYQDHLSRDGEVLINLLTLFNVPNFVGVFHHCPVRSEFADPGHIKDSFFRPAFFV